MVKFLVNVWLPVVCIMGNSLSFRPTNGKLSCKFWPLVVCMVGNSQRDKWQGCGYLFVILRLSSLQNIAAMLNSDNSGTNTGDLSVECNKSSTVAVLVSISFPKIRDTC